MADTAHPASDSKRPSKRRKPSPTSHASSPGPQLQQQQPVVDSSIIAPPPAFSAHNAQLAPSEFDFYSTSRSHPSNKQNYRYTPCGPSAAVIAQTGLQVHRMIESIPQNVRFSWEDRSSFVLITEDARTITTEKGWRAARTNVPLREGNYYWEIKIERAGGEGGRETGGVGEGSWARVGVGRRESPLNAPVGFDGHSYAYRDRSGDAVTLSRPKPFGKAYGSHSTIGIYLSLPPRPTPDPSDRRDPARIVRKRVPIRYKGQLYFESLEYAPSKEMEDLNIDPATKAKVVVEEKKKAAPGTKAPPPVEDLAPPPRPLPKLAQSKLAFFLDGECQGVAYEDLYDFLPLRLHPGGRDKKGIDPRDNWHDDGMTGYYPIVSVFGGAIATLNPGPEFDFPPPDDIEAVLTTSSHPPSSAPLLPPSSSDIDPERSWTPLSDRYVSFLAEQTHLDDLDEIETMRVWQASQLAEEKRGLPPAKTTLPPSSLSSSSTTPAKKAKLPAASAKALEHLGAIKKEDVVNVGSPASSLAPSRAASPAPLPPFSLNAILGSAVGPSALREMVPESEDEDADGEVEMFDGGNGDVEME